MHGDTCANLWVIYRLVGIGSFCPLHPMGSGGEGAPYLDCSYFLGPGSSLCILMTHLESGGGGGAPTWELEEGVAVKKG